MIHSSSRSQLTGPFRFAGITALVAATLLTASRNAQADGAVLAPVGGADLTTVDVQLAVAVAPSGTTRWSRLTVTGPSSVLWLVPARPGAALDWAADGWLDSLEGAGSVRVLPPSLFKPPCAMPATAQKVASWSSVASKTSPRTVTTRTSAADVRAFAQAEGFVVSASESARIDDAYANGFALVALELDTAGQTVTTPTLRISDDGAAILPLALTGGALVDVHVTATVIAEGGADLPGAAVLPASEIRWNAEGSTFGAARDATLAAGSGVNWLRESASHAVLFDGVPVPTTDAVAPLSDSYFQAATGQAQPACSAAVATAAASSLATGRVCATGALLVVPGGTACVPSTGSVDPAAFTCGAGIDDLALALSELAPSKATLTRFTGRIPQGSLGSDVAITTGSTLQSSVLSASEYAACPPSAATEPSAPTSPAPPPPLVNSTPREKHYVTESTCTGSTTSVVYDDDGESDEVESSGCGGDSSSKGSDDSSSSSSDDSSSGCDSKSSSDDSGFDKADDDNCSIVKGSTNGSGGSGHSKKHHRSSPMSRYALLLVALILPLRRRLRATTP